jgi:segregation and condensation protein A
MSQAPANSTAPQTEDVFTSGLETLTIEGPRLGGGEDEFESLIVELDGFEGPLDLLLVLARAQKVDLRKISILALVDQYLGFIAAAKRVRLELAADYLVMAAWLTYMKSRLLLPEPPRVDGEPTGEELAARLAFQLQRLEAMRRVAARLMSRDRLGRDVFARGAPEGVRIVRRTAWEATLFDLLKGYSVQRALRDEPRYEVRRRAVWAIEAARARLEAMLGKIPDWTMLEFFLPEAAPAAGEDRRTFLASAFSAALELAKEGEAELRQDGLFAPLYIRAPRKSAPSQA